MSRKLPVKIIQVGYSRLNNLGNYENERIEVLSRVEEGQDPNKILEYLEGWVSRQLLIRRRKSVIKTDKSY